MLESCFFACTVENAVRFNSDLSTWSVGRVTDMGYMFRGASAFNADISSWQVGAVEDISYMFNSATSFNQDLCQWGLRLDSSTLASEAFEFSACQRVEDPNFAATPPGPFCFVCN